MSDLGPDWARALARIGVALLLLWGMTFCLERVRMSIIARRFRYPRRHSNWLDTAISYGVGLIPALVFVFLAVVYVEVVYGW